MSAIAVSKDDLLVLTQYALSYAISDQVRKVAQRCENLCAKVHREEPLEPKSHQQQFREIYASANVSQWATEAEKILDAAVDAATHPLLEALIAVKDNATFDEATHRASMDEWVISKVRAAISGASQGVIPNQGK